MNPFAPCLNPEAPAFRRGEYVTASTKKKETRISFLARARIWQQMGVSVIPIASDKRPLCKYAHLFDTDLTLDDLRALPWSAAKGMAALLGKLRAFDFDHLPYTHIQRVLALLGLSANYPYQAVTPGGGYHLYFFCDDLPDSALKRYHRHPATPAGENSAIELRLRGVTINLPHSHHPSGGVYSWVGDAPRAPHERPDTIAWETVWAAYQTVTVAPAEPPARTSIRPSLSGDDLPEQVKARIDLVDYIARREPVEKRGAKFFFKWRDERTASACIYPESGSFHDFGSGESGDVFTYVQQRDALDFRQALTQLAHELGLAIPDPVSRPTMPASQLDDAKNAFSEKSRRIAAAMLTPEKLMQIEVGRAEREAQKRRNSFISAMKDAHRFGGWLFKPETYSFWGVWYADNTNLSVAEWTQFLHLGGTPDPRKSVRSFLFEREV